MSKYIKKDSVIKSITSQIISDRDATIISEMMLADVPEEDVIDVVRCKDCKYWLPHTQCGFDEDNDEYHNYCNYHMPDDEWYAGYWEADDYCSYGERKDNE